MKLYKRLQKRLAVAATIATVFTAASVPTFAASDYENHWAAAAITEWKDKGVINGYEDGSFKPKQSITRAELATILVKVFGLTDKTGAETFSDVPSNAWFADAVAKVSAAGIMYTDGNSFGPNRPATREEAAYALAKAYKLSGGSGNEFKDNASISSWSQDEIAALVGGGYISGRPDGTFAPKDQLTRADLITMVDKITAELYNVAGTYSQNVAGNVVINTKDVVLKDMTISGNLYIAQGVGDGDVILENVEVTGEVFVDGGGLNSIKLNGKTAIKKLTVNKPGGNVRIVASADAKVDQVEAKSDVALEGTFGEVVATKAVTIKVLGKSVIAKITVVKTAGGLKLELSADTVVDTVELEAKADITGKGKVQNLKLADNIKKSDLKLEATIKTITGGDTSSTGGSSGSSNTTNNSNNNSSSSGGSSSSSSSYAIVHEQKDGYTIDIASKAKKGKLVNFTVTTAEGYIVTGITMNDQPVTVVDANKGEYSFIMPKAKAIIKVTAEKANPGTANPGTDNPGTDNPGTDNPGTDNPGTDNPGTDNPVEEAKYSTEIKESKWKVSKVEGLKQGIDRTTTLFTVKYGTTTVTDVIWKVTTGENTVIDLDKITTTGTYKVNVTAKADDTTGRKEKIFELELIITESTTGYSFELLKETETPEE